MKISQDWLINSVDIKREKGIRTAVVYPCMVYILLLLLSQKCVDISPTLRGRFLPAELTHVRCRIFFVLTSKVLYTCVFGTGECPLPYVKISQAWRLWTTNGRRAYCCNNSMLPINTVVAEILRYFADSYVEGSLPFELTHSGGRMVYILASMTLLVYLVRVFWRRRVILGRVKGLSLLL